MKTWQSQYAEAHFAELLESSLRDGPQTLKELLLAVQARTDIPVPQRGRGKRRLPIETL